MLRPVVTDIHTGFAMHGSAVVASALVFRRIRDQANAEAGIPGRHLRLRWQDGLTMVQRYLLPSLAAVLGRSALLDQPLTPRLVAQSTPTIALRGHVSSASEPAMEGVIVTANKAGASISTSVVTDARGDFQFP